MKSCYMFIKLRPCLQNVVTIIHLANNNLTTTISSLIYHFIVCEHRFYKITIVSTSNNLTYL